MDHLEDISRTMGVTSNKNYTGQQSTAYLRAAVDNVRSERQRDPWSTDELNRFFHSLGKQTQLGESSYLHKTSLWAWKTTRQ